MDKEAILEGNLLIAAFMPDMSFHKYGGEYAFPELWHKSFDETAYTTYLPLELKYHQSWDWIMPVVENINASNKYDVIIFKTTCHVNDWDGILFETSHEMSTKGCLILSVWEPIVQFIKWHNENAIPNKKSSE